METNPTATSASFVISPVELADAGYYRAVATNTGGSITSDAAQLTVTYPNPAISQQPVTRYAQTGSTVTFQVLATGYGNLSYQWFKNGDPLDGKTADSLELTNVSAADDGSYFVVVTDDIAPGLTTTSQTAFLYTYAPWSGLVSHEPFDSSAYVSGPLATQNPVISVYQDAWAITNGFGTTSPVVSATSLAYSNPSYLGSSGGSVTTPVDAAGILGTNSGRVGRLLAPALVVTNQTTGTRYLSWLFKSGNENAAPDAQVHQTLALFQGALGTDANRRFEAGSSLSNFGNLNYGVRLNNNNTLRGDLTLATDANVHLFVAKFELSADAVSDVVTVWIDPTLGSGDPSGGVTLASHRPRLGPPRAFRLRQQLVELGRDPLG